MRGMAHNQKERNTGGDERKNASGNQAEGVESEAAIPQLDFVNCSPKHRSVK